MDYLLFPLIATLAAIPMIGMTIFLWQWRWHPGAQKLLYLVVAVLGWLIFNTLELVDPTPAGTQQWARLTYLFISSTPVFWVQFVADYHDHPEWLRPPRMALLWIIPVITIILVLTNDWHGLIWRSFSFFPVGNYLADRVVHGPFYWVGWVYSQLLLLGGAVVLVQDNLKNYRLYRWQMIWITLGLMLVIGFNVVYLSRVIPGLQKDYTPVSAVLGIFCVAVAVARYRLIDTVPMGRSALFDSLDESVIAVKEDGRLVDINPAARKMFGLTSPDIIGKPLKEILPVRPEWLDYLNKTEEFQRELLVRENPPLYMDVRVSSLLDQQGRSRGRLIIVRDITERKLGEIAEREMHELAEALRNTAAALNSSLDIELVLDQILNNVQRVMHCDTANLMMIEKDVARTVRRLGDDAPEISLPLEDTPVLFKMIQERQPMVIPDVDAYPDWVQNPIAGRIKSFVGAPILVEKKVIGFINLDSPVAGAYSQVHADRLKAFADQAATAIHNARLFSRVAELATMDELTGLYNRRSFFIHAIREVNRSLRSSSPLAAIMIDLDHFKRINDTFGHSTGDCVLQKVGEVLRKELREEDLCGRYGGEEFVVLLPDTNGPEALKAAERLRTKIEALEVPISEDVVGVTASLGISLMPSSYLSLEELIEQADNALYLAKQNGRNRVETV